MMMHVIFIIAFVVIYNIYRYYREQKNILNYEKESYA